MHPAANISICSLQTHLWPALCASMTEIFESLMILNFTEGLGVTAGKSGIGMCIV